MRILIATGILFLVSFPILADTGDIIDEFSLSGQPGWGVYGLAKDWEDGNIWAVGMDTYEFCKLGKFHNDSHVMLKNWEYLDLRVPPLWVGDIAYPYEKGGKKCIVVADAERPELRLYDPSDCSYAGEIPINPFGNTAFNTGIAANPDTCNLFTVNYHYTEVHEWDHTNWSTLTSYTNSPNYGVAYGWNHIFVGISDPTNSIFKIMVFKEDGTFVEEYVINGWTHFFAGICCAHEDAVGKNESLYVTFTAYAKIREVEVGNFSEATGELDADVDVISKSTGGTANFTLTAGVENANLNYLLLGSISGTSPGFPLPGGGILPLNRDAFTDLILGAITTPYFSNFWAALDAQGGGTAQLDTFGPINIGSVGMTMYFAYAVNTNPWGFASNHVEIEIVP